MKWVGSLFIWLFLSGGQALAQSEGPEHEREQANDLFKEAESLYEFREFNEALETYKVAYHLSKEPALLLHIGQCYQQLQRNEDAASAYRAYLSLLPESPLALELEELSAKLEKSSRQSLSEREQEEAAEALFSPQKISALPTPTAPPEPARPKLTTRTPEGFSPKPLYTSALTFGALGLFLGGVALREAKDARQLQEGAASIEEFAAGANKAKALAHASSALLGTMVVLYWTGRSLSQVEALRVNNLRLQVSPTSAALSLKF